MKTTKKQIKKELKKVKNLVSDLSKKKVLNNQENLSVIHDGMKDIKRVVKFILNQKKSNLQQEDQKDLVVE